MSRLLIVANRLPITVEVTDGQMAISASPGGLATGLRGPHRQTGGLWFGWPGDTTGLDAAQRADLARHLDAERMVPVALPQEDVQGFYEGVSNGVLWPLFHYLLDQVPLEVSDWGAYERVNQAFADAVAAQHQPDDMIWVHDYQLMLVPQMLRQQLPDARIGFFLHVPFPASEVFRTLPVRDRLLEGLLGADLVGFHTAAYMRHFASSLLRILGLPTDVDRVLAGDRQVHLGVFPMGIDAARFAALGDDAGVAREAAELRGSDGCQTLVAIDRLDYTKGLPRRLLAFEKLLRNHPALIGRVRLIQVAVPSRAAIGAYQDFRHQVDAMIGRLNGTFGTPHWVPVHYIYRSLSEQELAALYRAADVMLVTPVRDGMNLVAKEFVAARGDEDGVLVLSEFAGAAAELAEALVINPYDIERAAETYYRALTMPAGERRTRLRALRWRVMSNDVHHWVAAFLLALEHASAQRETPSLRPTAPAVLFDVVRRMREAPHLLLLLDYDGTLSPFAAVPELAAPDSALLTLLARLAARPRTTVHVVSGRRRDTLEQWLGELPIGLHAEHGLWSRPRPGSIWQQVVDPPTAWRERVMPILQDFVANTPGSLIEEKTASLAWHYRMVDPEYGAAHAQELQMHLAQMLSNAPVEILRSAMVVEIRPHGVHKGLIVPPLLEAAPPDTLVVAIGDDRTDEDLFAALPADALSIHVGPQASRAALRIVNVDAARRLLAALLDDADASELPAKPTSAD
ncbi:MAG: bifunctional alpha,alpha-trehalose-phosphate synthase (UDP-forming)/trehalose-phosphatase [bacterium]